MLALPSRLSLTSPAAPTKMVATGLTNQEHPVYSMLSQTALKPRLVQIIHVFFYFPIFQYIVTISHIMTIHSSYSQTVKAEVNGEGSEDSISELDRGFTTSTPIIRVRTLCWWWWGWTYRGHGVRAFYLRLGVVQLYIFVILNLVD